MVSEVISFFYTFLYIQTLKWKLEEEHTNTQTGWGKESHWVQYNIKNIKTVQVCWATVVNYIMYNNVIYRVCMFPKIKDINLLYISLCMIVYAAVNLIR